MLVLEGTKRFSTFCYNYPSYGISERARRVLVAQDLDQKCQMIDALVKEYREGTLSVDTVVGHVPDYPGRPNTYSSRSIPPSSSSKAAKFPVAVVMLHGICHAESYAVDLFLDLLARFGQKSAELPQAFYDDFVEVCRQEADHFSKWRDRLGELGVEYGALPTHDGLWRAAYETRGDLLERLCVINMVHEARGLDTYPLSRKKLVNARDLESVAIIDKNFEEEIEHVSKGVRWFTYVCEQRRLDAKATFQAIVKSYMKLPLKGPFNEEARDRAGFHRSWYMELT